tara:strand:- start:244 stop:501 length:258 start_codon:yes stop_codon:yes gene_type:complete
MYLHNEINISDMKKHILWMVVGCGLPLLLIFFAPALGINGNVSTFIFIMVLFACHLLMPMHHTGHKDGHSHNHSRTTKTNKHESH